MIDTKGAVERKELAEFSSFSGSDGFYG